MPSSVSPHGTHRQVALTDEPFLTTHVNSLSQPVQVNYNSPTQCQCQGSGACRCSKKKKNYSEMAPGKAPTLSDS